ncbi:MAG: N-acetyltransferase [Candidatus Omnitrophica bacterium]|nr:N-acetyltransferase [Candidatus Omnitrophota bacterium]
MMIRKAKIEDVKQIQSLINHFAKQDIMLPRSLNEIYDNIRDFWVFEDKHKVTGCCALHVCWQDLTEIKSLAVDKSRQGMGIGRKLVEACIAEAGEMGAAKIFVLTYQPRFFKKFGFKKTSTASLPHKVWAECINCPKFPHCQETAMVKRI